MDAMVDIVKQYAGKVSEAVTAKIAAYIATGKDDEVFKSLPLRFSTHYSVPYHVKSHLNVIRRDMTPAELPRFYHMMTLLQHMQGAVKDFIYTLVENGMPDALIASHKDEKELFQRINLCFDTTHMIINDQRIFHTLFETFYKHDPAMLERLLPTIDTPYNYLLRFYMLNKDYARYKSIEPAFAEDAKKTAEAVIINKDGDISRLKSTDTWLFGSFVAYGISGKITDIINNTYNKAPVAALTYMLVWGWEIIRDKMLELGMDIAPLFATYANSNKSSSSYLLTQISNMFAGHFDTVNKALALANDHGKGVLYFYLAQCGEPVDIAAFERILLGKVNTTEQAKKWLAEGSTDPKWLVERRNSTDIVNPDGIAQNFAGSLLGQSAVAMRYTQMLIFRDDRQFDVQEIFKFADKKYANDIINALDNEKLLIALSTVRKYHSAESQPWDYIMTAIAVKNPALYKKAFTDAKDNDSHVYLAMCLPKDFDVDFFIELLDDKSKKIGAIAFNILKEKPELKAKIAPLAEARKKAVREYAEKLLMHYDGGSENIKEMSEADIAVYYKKYGKNIDKALEWTNPQSWPKVRKADSDKAVDEITLKYYVYQFLNSKAMEIPPHTQGIAKSLNALDRHALAADIYSQWIGAGGEAKKKGALLLFGVNADNSDVVTLHKQIIIWADGSRGAIAADAVKAMALSGQDLALMQVDSIANKFKNKQVRKAATESFALAASAMGLSADQLADRIVPDLGFDQRGEKEVDFGTRKFTAFLTPALAVELKDEAGKAIKTLPKPGAKDDEAKANAAKAEFTALKKSLKTVVTTQAGRLENALSSGRSWTIEAWTQLFVKNPIMHSFAMGLIWGFYKDKALVATFRYMSDGSLSDIDDNSLSFDDYKDHTIGLVHPLELSEEAIEAWKEQLDDYEITQPLLQLRRPVFTITDKEKEGNFIERFGGVTLPGITLINKLAKMGWSKGSVQDGGAFTSTYKEFPENGIGVQLNHSYLYVMLEIGEDVKMGQVAFYKAGTVERGSYVYDEPEKFIPLKNVPAKLFSEVVYNLDEASKTSTTKDEGWKNDRDISFF